MWKWQNGAAIQLWNETSGALPVGPGLSADRNFLAMSVRQGDQNNLIVARSDGNSARTLAPKLDLRGSPSWSPDGKWIVVSADAGEGGRVFRVLVDGGTRFSSTTSFPSGRFHLRTGN